MERLRVESTPAPPVLLRPLLAAALYPPLHVAEQTMDKHDTHVFVVLCCMDVLVSYAAPIGF
jgi:hypothetical protein